VERTLRDRDVERAFTHKLGADRDDSGDHVYFYLHHQGSDYTVGKLSHSWSGDLNNTQVGMLARKLCLQKREFEQLVACSLDAEDAIAIWQSRRPPF
jgi:hypothetical protein